MLVIYHMMLYIQHRKKIYLYYSLYMFFLSLYVFATNYRDVLGQELMTYNGLFLLMSYTFYFLLVKIVLNTSKNHSALDNLLKYGIIILSALGPIFPLITLIFGFKIFIDVYNVFAIILAIYSVIIYVYLFRVKSRYAKYLITGSLIYFICSMIVLFTGIFMGSNAFLEFFGFPLLLISYIGTLFEALIFASLIGFKTKETELEKVINEASYELEIQKTTTLLKEQEINTINAMIEGQEKERLHIARDLHDSLGGTLAAVKMHIDNLQINIESSHNPQELLDKANILISEAYTSVRSIAHERNSGVMAKEGLLPAIEKLANKVSTPSGLTIEIQHFGLEERLSNHLEITIFRIIQELVTNVIKHAQATELQISLTQHQEELNIVVEDNGKGFIVGKLPEKDGMGLGSIERRVEHLEGTMEVDSTPSKGTNIIIDIPI